ncbi:MAG: CHAT domain-containing protein [Myxococcales bacterium]|nr:CHAT domain-containing protein [Myxococcales bacterium]
MSFARFVPRLLSCLSLCLAACLMPSPAAADAGPADAASDALTPELEALVAHANAAQTALEAGDLTTSAREWVAAVDALGPAGEDPAEYGGLVMVAAYAAVASGPLPDARRMVALVERLPAAEVTDELPELAEAAALRSREAGEAGDAAGGLALVDAALAVCERHLGPTAEWTVNLHIARAGLLLVLGQNTAAAAAAATALDRAPRAGTEPAYVGGAARIRGQALHALGRLDDAIAAMEASVTAWQGAFDADGTELAEAWHILADLREQAGRLPAARAAYVAAHTLRVARAGEATPEAALAGCHLDLLRGSEGAIHSPDPVDCERLDAVTAPLGDHPRAAQALALLGRAWLLRGRPGEALPALDAVVAMRSVAGDPDELAEALRRRAGVDVLLGDPAAAQARMIDGLAVVEAAGDPAARALWLHDLAAVELQLGDTAAADRRLAVAAALDAPADVRAALWVARAVLLDDAGRAEEARPLFEAAGRWLDAAGEHPAAGYWRARIADNALRRGDEATAKAMARAALVAVERRATSEYRWEVLTRYALQAWVDDDNTVAIFHAKHAVDALQAMRGDLAERAAGFVAGFQSHYQSLAELLVEERGRLAEAQAVTAMLRAAEFAEYTRGAVAVDRGAPVPRTAAERRWELRYTAAVDDLRAGVAAGEGSAADARFIDAVAALEAEMRAAEAAGQRSFDAETVAALAARQSMLAALDTGRDGRTALVHVILGRDATHLLVTTAARQWFYRAPLGRTDLNARADALHRALRDRGAWRGPAEALYRDLIAPLRPELAADDIDTLLWSLDGALRYVPMAALVDPASGRFLVEDFALARFADPVAAVFDRPRRAPDRVAAFGAAAGAPALGLAPLPGVRLELAMIVREGAGAGVLPGTVAVDGAFTADALLRALGAAPVVHVASHFVFEPGPADASYLLLGDGSTLSLAAFADLRLDGIELLTLSACQTAVGTFAEGQPLDGFAALALQQGARAVVASLWPVLDDSTAELMARFYERLAAGDRKVDALRAAQRAMLGARGGGPSRKLSLPGEAAVDLGPHPYTWAPFVLVGDPR